LLAEGIELPRQVLQGVVETLPGLGLCQQPLPLHLCCEPLLTCLPGVLHRLPAHVTEGTRTLVFRPQQLTFRTPSDGDPHIFLAACFARTANPNRDMLLSHARRYTKRLRLWSMVWVSCYRPSKRIKFNIYPS